MVKSWKYIIDNNRYLIFVQGSTSNEPEQISQPVVLRDEAIVGLKVKRGVSEVLTGVFSHSIEIEFNLMVVPSDFTQEILLPSKVKKFRAGRNEYDVFLKCGLVVFFYEFGNVRFAGIHAENYFDADIDVRRNSCVVTFIELSRYIMECFDEAVHKLIWTGVYKTQFLQFAEKVYQLIDFRVKKNNFEIRICRRKDTDNLLAFNIGSIVELLKSVFEDLCKSLLAREVVWLIGLPLPLVYKRVENTQGKEIRGEVVTDVYVISQKNEAPFWFISQNHKTFWDFFVDWCISCAKQALFTYSITDKLYLGCWFQTIDEASYNTYHYGEAKKVIIRPLNSNWVKASLIEGAELGVSMIEERQFASASGDAKGITCMFDTFPLLVSGLDVKSEVDTTVVHWQYKLFYKDDEIPATYHRVCDLQVSEFNWDAYFQDGVGIGFVRGYKDYVNRCSYLRGLMDYYKTLIFNNSKAIGIEIETTLDSFDTSTEHKLAQIHWIDFFGHSLFSNFCDIGVVKSYILDYVSKRTTLEIIMVRQ